jgi:hypothetical protein
MATASRPAAAPAATELVAAGYRGGFCAGRHHRHNRDNAMSWNPSTRELELLCEHASARVPAETTARMLGAPVEDLHELAQRLG